VPLPGIVVMAIEEVGIGLTPGDASSVEPSGIPVGDTDEPDVASSGEVAPMVGVGVAIAPICAIATLPDRMRTPARIGVARRKARIELLRRISAEWERKIGVVLLAACSRRSEEVSWSESGRLARTVQLNTSLCCWC
jgi:hypothetical protein